MRMVERLMAGFLVLALALPAAAAGLEDLKPLLGHWEGSGGGAPGPSAGATDFTLGLQGRVIVRNNFAEYPAANGKPASRHDDLMVIYAAGPGLRADYWDNEGHVIRYAVAAEPGGSFAFTSDAAAGSPRFRLTYAVAGDRMQGRFEMAPPDKPEAFAKYLEWTAARKAAAH